MNNKGFTLIELIIVVAIIAILSLVFATNILGLINKNNTKTYNSIVQSIKSAAENYITDSRYKESVVADTTRKCKTESTMTYIIKLEKLINEGYLTKLPENPCKDNPSLNFKTDDKVTVNFDCNSKHYTYIFRNKINVSECENRG